MSLNATPSSERLHIGFFGLRNAGKSSVVNAITGQKMSLTSEVKGTTTDPVKKAMEILPIGPVVIIDTPGLDDEGELGKMRVERAKEVLSTIDIAVLIVDSIKGMQKDDVELVSYFKQKSVPYLIVFNKCDLLDGVPKAQNNVIYVSAEKNINIFELKEKLAHMVRDTEQKELLSDLVDKDDVVVLVTPIDESAPKGRMILPQQEVIRAVLDCGAIDVVTKETELERTLNLLNVKPKLVITDSQAFEKVSKIVPDDIPLTSFSILFARYKGDLDMLLNGAFFLDQLKDGDSVLISEACTHHRQCNDIGTVKLPNWIREYTKKDLNFEFSSGGSFPGDLNRFSLIVHCGGCMITEKEMKKRIEVAESASVPITNYGTLIAHIHGILTRASAVFKHS